MTHWPTDPPGSPRIPQDPPQDPPLLHPLPPDPSQISENFTSSNMTCFTLNFEIVEKRENTKKHGLTLLPHYTFER